MSFNVAVIMSVMLTSPTLASESPIKQGQQLAERTLSGWKACLVATVDRYSRSDEEAGVIADVAFSKCSEWDVAVKKASSHELAVSMMRQMPFPMALKAAEEGADETLTQVKAKLKPRLMARVMDNRIPKASKR